MWLIFCNPFKVSAVQGNIWIMHPSRTKTDNAMILIAPFRVVGFTKLLFVNLPGMSFKILYKRIQVSWLCLIWLSLLADLFSVSRTQGAEYDELYVYSWRWPRRGLIDDVSNTCPYIVCKCTLQKMGDGLLWSLSKTVLNNYIGVLIVSLWQ